MARKRGIKGKSPKIWVPDWEPLLDLAPLHVADFGWYYAVALADGARIQVYRHYWTREWLHLDGDGRAFLYVEPSHYEQVDPAWLLSRVLREHTADLDWFDITHPLRVEPEKVQIEWTDSAARNGISRERAEHVVKHCGLRYKHRASHEAPRWDDLRTLFLGEDQEGVQLEVAALGDDDYGDHFVVFHAAELRDLHKCLLRRAERWRQ